jgi:phospholipid/cholesterol/gamma-HCH transport system substrate-binding protein
VRDERRNYLVAGGFVIAMLAALLVWIVELSGGIGATERYFVLYDRVPELREGIEVRFDGYPVGEVERVVPVEVGERRRFRVELGILRGWRVPADSRARVVKGLFSGVVIDIRGGTSKDSIASEGEIRGEEGGDVFADLQSVARRFDAIAEQLQPLIRSASEGGPEILENVRALTADLDRASEQLGALLSPENADRVGRTLANVEATSASLAELTRELESTRTGIDDVLARIGELVDEERGDLSEAVRDLNHSLAAVARHIDAIAADLETSSRNLAEFTRQVREDPGLIVRGRERAGDGAQP